MNLRQIVLGVAALAIIPHLLLGQEPRVKDTLPPAPAGKTWKLVWHDEFDGTALDMKKWGYDARDREGRLVEPQSRET